MAVKRLRSVRLAAAGGHAARCHRDDEDNLVSCQVAKHKYNVPRTIARIRNPQNADFFKKLGVDATVSTTDLIIQAIEREVPTHP